MKTKIPTEAFHAIAGTVHKAEVVRFTNLLLTVPSEPGWVPPVGVQHQPSGLLIEFFGGTGYIDLIPLGKGRWLVEWVMRDGRRRSQEFADIYTTFFAVFRFGFA